MSRIIALSAAALALLLAGVAWTLLRSEEARAPDPVVVDRAYGLGDIVPDFAFTGLDGRQSTLEEYSTDGPVVILMRDAKCPVSRRYGPTTSRLEHQFGGVRFLYVNVSPLDTPADLRADRDRYELIGTYVHDPDWRIARLLHVFTTAEVFVLDGERRLRYRGAIDDQYGIRFTKPEPREHYLRDALQQILDGGEVTRPSTAAEGCYLAAEVRQVRHEHAGEPAR